MDRMTLDRMPRPRVVLGLGLEGPLHTRRLPTQGALGSSSSSSPCIYVDEAAFLRDLEARLGLSSVEVSLERAHTFRARMQETVRPEHFYARSLERHPVEAATTLLAYRDMLVASGWNGKPVLGGGPRLDALAELELPSSFPGLVLGPGRVDRVRAVHRALLQRAKDSGAEALSALYEGVDLVEAREYWPTQWQRIFGSFESAGIVVREAPPFSPRAPLASGSTDLGKLQRLLAKRAIVDEPVLRFDGSLSFLHGKTLDSLAASCARQVREHLEKTLVVRLGEPVPLDRAIARLGIPTGAVHRVDHPSAIVAPAACVLAWNLSPLAEAELEPEIFTREETRALEASGVYLPDARVVADAEAEAWRRLVFSAEESLVLALPPALSGKDPQEHSLVVEILVRMGLQSSAEGRARLTVEDDG
jgi:hypothetical protein